MVFAFHTHALDNLIIIICNNISKLKDMYLYRNGKCVYGIGQMDSVPDSLDDLKKHIKPVRFEIIMLKILANLDIIFESVKPNLCKAGEERGWLQYQLFGMDVLLEADSMEPYILEFNKQPEMRIKSKYDNVLKPQLQKDITEFIEYYKHSSRYSSRYSKNSKSNNWIKI